MTEWVCRCKLGQMYLLRYSAWQRCFCKLLARPHMTRRVRHMQLFQVEFNVRCNGWARCFSELLARPQHDWAGPQMQGREVVFYVGTAHGRAVHFE